jgi:hypothetical protein
MVATINLKLFLVALRYFFIMLPCCMSHKVVVLQTSNNSTRQATQSSTASNQKSCHRDLQFALRSACQNSSCKRLPCALLLVLLAYK